MVKKANKDKMSGSSFRITKETHPFYCEYNDDKYIKSHDVRSKIVVEENRMKYSLINDLEKEAVVYHVDGGVITSRGKNDSKCDFGIYTEDELLVLVELKGCDYPHAVEQILGTIDKLGLKNSGKVKRLMARVVLSNGSRVPEIQSRNERDLKLILKENNGNLEKRTKIFEEKLSDIQA